MIAHSRWALAVPLFFALACGHAPHQGADHGDGEMADAGESWGFTAWGERYEIFAEADPFEVGITSLSHTHVTILDGFAPLREGVVSAVLRSADGDESVFSQDRALRDGIFSVAIVPEEAGEFTLLFRVEGPVGREEISAGRVGVGSENPGDTPPAPPTSLSGSGEPISFLKEQQWRTSFGTARVERSSIQESVRGPGRVRPVTGGEVILTAPADGIAVGAPWPFPGFEAERGAALFQITPRVAAERSLADLEAGVSQLRAELAAARSRSQRLDALLELEAASRREVEEATVREATLEAGLTAAIKDLQTAKRARQGAPGDAERIAVTAPFAGRVVQVEVTPGQAVAAGEALARFVRPQPLWVEVALRPGAAARLATDPAGLHLSGSALPAPITLPQARVRLISSAPAVDPVSGTVPVLLEVDATADELRLGTVVEAEILLPQEREGVVIPTAALVDDGGVEVVYLQVEGESFLRREVEVLVRQGELALVEGVAAGERAVVRGGNAIRRATLVAKDVGEGHVH